MSPFVPASSSGAFLCSLLLMSCVSAARTARINVAVQTNVHAALKTNVQTSSCPCWNILSHLKPEDCCYRTDAGSMSGQTSKCAAHAVIANVTIAPEDDCSTYCNVNCFKISHPADKQGIVDYLGEKATEVGKMGPADLLLGRAVAQANLLKKYVTSEYIEVKGIHPIHPVGSWREDTWKKTLGRKDSVLNAADKIIRAGGKLLKADIDSTESLRPMRSVTNFIAVPFLFNGITYVTLEGNGRIKGMQLAAQERPEQLGNLAVEVDLFHFDPAPLQTVQEGILELWNQYVEEAFRLDFKNASLQGQLQEYVTFRVGVVKCMGTYEGLLKSRSHCKVENKDGKNIRSVPVGTLLGVERKCKMPNGGTRYKLHAGPVRFGPALGRIGDDEYLVDTNDMVAYEYCPKCPQRVTCGRHVAF